MTSQAPVLVLDKSNAGETAPEVAFPVFFLAGRVINEQACTVCELETYVLRTEGSAGWIRLAVWSDVSGSPGVVLSISTPLGFSSLPDEQTFLLRLGCPPLVLAAGQYVWCGVYIADSISHQFYGLAGGPADPLKRATDGTNWIGVPGPRAIWYRLYGWLPDT